MKQQNKSSKRRSTNHSNNHDEALSQLAAIVESSDDAIIGKAVEERTAELLNLNARLEEEVAQRARAQEALKASEELHRVILTNISDAVFITDSAGVFTYICPNANVIFNYSYDEIMSLGNIANLIGTCPYDEAVLRKNGEIPNIELEITDKIGRRRTLLVNVKKVSINRGELLYTCRDITERKKEGAQLHEQAALLDYAQDAIIVRDLEGCVLYWNKSAERISGWSVNEALGKDIRDLLYKENLSHYEAAMDALTEKGEWVGELRQRTKEGTEIIAESHWTLVPGETGKPASVFAINTDITEKKKLEAQFLRAQRMESIGTLSSGIAHNLGNLLSPILLSVQLLKRKFTDEESQHMLAILQINAERAGEMTRQVLEFARGIQGERIELLPTHVMKEVASILESTLPKSIDVGVSISGDLLPVVGDANQLHQVLMNLCINARDAMPEGGSLTIGGENTYIDENYARMQLEAKPGQYVVISVADTGVGIPADVLGRIFEPFFTTKELGKGTGLGLPSIRAIVKGHEGFINVYSEVGKGTEFRIYIPAATTPETKSVEGGQPAVPVGHGELILVVDDELPILEVARKTLEENGYKVLIASDGAEALAQYAEHRKEVDAILIDMVMPYLDGAATIRALRKLNPDVKIIASSGLAANDKLFEDADVGVRTFLSKPYSAEKLLRALSEILAAQ